LNKDFLSAKPSIGIGTSPSVVWSCWFYSSSVDRHMSVQEERKGVMDNSIIFGFGLSVRCDMLPVYFGTFGWEVVDVWLDLSSDGPDDDVPPFLESPSVQGVACL
jgi:hypothetical protein